MLRCNPLFSWNLSENYWASANGTEDLSRLRIQLDANLFVKNRVKRNFVGKTFSLKSGKLNKDA